MVFVASYPPDSAGVIRTAYEQKLQTRMFGGAMIGLQYSELKQQLGPMLNNVLCYEFYVPAPTTNFPGIKEFLATYQERAKKAGADLLGFYLPPYAYAGMEVLEKAVTATKGLDRINRPSTTGNTGQVWPKSYGVKFCSANSAPTVISVTGPRMLLILLRSPFMANLPRRRFLSGKARPQHIGSGRNQQHRPEPHDPFEIHQVERVQQ